MELVYRRREKIVGLFVLSVVILLMSSVVLVGRGKNWFESYIEYYAIFDESYNLQRNSAVKLHRADIGRVKRIDLTGNQVRIDIAILEKYQPQITQGSSVTVKSPTIIGDEYLAVMLGDSQAQVLPEGSRIESIPKKSLTEFLAEFQVEETAKKLTTAVHNISEMTTILKDPQGPLLVGLEELNKTLANIADAATRTPETMDHVNASLATINKIGDELYFNLSHIKNLLTSVEQSLQRLKSSLDNVETASGDIPRITGSTLKSIDEMRDTMDETRRVIQAMQNTFLLRGGIPPLPEEKMIEADLRK